MNCMNCGAFLADSSLDYCPSCGANIQIQKKADYLSKYHYNLGLEKAQIRDLSGAIGCLRQSLTYNKKNIQARNLLGLVYFETGEVVAALSEWVISKNLMPNRNLAGDYIARLQANTSRLDAINDTIRKYNEALALARQRHDDMAAVQLRRILTQNPKLIKGYHLLALILMKNREWARARRILRRAARIDKTNTTTLRFLLEIDEQIGLSRNPSGRSGGLFVRKKTVADSDDLSGDAAYPASLTVTEPGRGSLFAMLLLGTAVGAVAFWLLAVPAIRQRIYREANRQIVKYSESVSSQGAELSRAMGEMQESADAAEILAGQLTEEQKKSASYEALLEAWQALREEDYDSAALAVQRVHESALTDSMKGIYNMICQQTGVSGITEDASQQADTEGYAEGSYEEESYEEDEYSGDYDESWDSYGYDDYYEEG